MCAMLSNYHEKVQQSAVKTAFRETAAASLSKLEKEIESMINQLNKIFLKTRFGKRLKIGRNVNIARSVKLVIDSDSIISIGNDVEIREFVELRATKASTLSIGNSVKVDRFIRVISTNAKKIEFCDRVRVGIGTIVNGGGNIHVGEDTLISGYVYLQTSMHNHKGAKAIIDNGYIYGDIRIEQGSWLGAHAVIFPGVTLGERTVVGSNAVVNRNTSKGATIGGIPARELSKENNS